MPAKKVKFGQSPQALELTQILCPQWEGHDGRLSYSTIGLAKDGSVWRFDPPCDGWIPWSMDKVGCKSTHKGNR